MAVTAEKLVTFISTPKPRNKAKDSDLLEIIFKEVRVEDLVAPSNYTAADNDLSTHLAGIDAALGTTVAADENAKVSANDTTTGFLEDKIVASDGANATNILEITTLNDGANEDLQIQIDQAKINHDALLNFVANEHIDHSGVSVIAASNSGLLAANNDLTANLGLAVNINGSTAETLVQDADELLIYDSSAGVLRKMTRANLLGSAALSMQSNKITNLADGTATSDAVNKGQLDAIAAGLDPKASVRLATTADLAATYSAVGGAGGTGQFTGAPTTIDGVAIAQGDRILVKDQSTQTQNGIYVVTATTTTWDRADDMDGSPANEVSGGNHTFIEAGTANAGEAYVLLGDGTLTLNTDNIVWSVFSNQSLTGGNGIEIIGSSVAVDLLASGGLKFVGDELAVEPADFAGTGLVDDGADNLTVDLLTAGGLKFSGNEIGVEPADFAGDGLEDDGADNLRLDLKLSGGLKFDTGEVAVEPADFAGNGLEDDGSDNLQVVADSTGGANLATAINVSANGVAVKVDDSTIQENGSGQLEVKKTKTLTAATGSSFAIREVGRLNAAGEAVKITAQTADLSQDDTYVVAAAAVSATTSGEFYILEGAVISGFTALDETVAMYLDRTTSAIVQTTAALVADEHLVRIGHPLSQTEIRFEPEHLAEL